MRNISKYPLFTIGFVLAAVAGIGFGSFFTEQAISVFARLFS